MATFTWRASRSSSKDMTPRVRTAKFGDGYDQRVGDGINTQLRVWSVRFDNRDTAEANAIDDFLSARNGVDAFDWTDLYGHAGKWVCEKWSRSASSGVTSTISATFREVPA
jgi:phage-related protein